jgi:hypothetical protein
MIVIMKLKIKRGERMTEEKLITICFMGTVEIKAQLEQWAAADERSVSYVLRQILKREAARRQAKPENNKPAAID